MKHSGKIIYLCKVVKVANKTFMKRGLYVSNAYRLSDDSINLSLHTLHNESVIERDKTADEISCREEVSECYDGHSTPQSDCGDSVSGVDTGGNTKLPQY